MLLVEITVELAWLLVVVAVISLITAMILGALAELISAAISVVTFVFYPVVKFLRRFYHAH